MLANQIEKYVEVLLDYCCEISVRDQVLIRSSYLSEPLILALQKEILRRGAGCELDITLPKFSRQYITHATTQQLQRPPILYKAAVESFDVIISIAAPFDIFELNGVDEGKLALRQQSLKQAKHTMMQRGAIGDLRWVICNYPTDSLAQAAGMSLEEYSEFIASACFLNSPDAIQEWRQLSKQQEAIVNLLNKGHLIEFRSDSVDISFKIKDRCWINSDGKRNMPSGEVFTSPIEDSADGWISFTVPSLLFGQRIEGLRLEFKEGRVVSWDAKQGRALISKLLSIDGANLVGEIAIGTNPNITQPTLNTLFDEKIGGTIHMALGASYPETGGKNVSSIHHDFITDFKTHSDIFLDGQRIYSNGVFV